MSPEHRDRGQAEKEDSIPHVTNFFREMSAYHTITTSLVPLIGEEDPLVASVGCSTGEEVYSLLALDGIDGDMRVVGYDRMQDRIEEAARGVYGITNLRFPYQEELARSSFDLGSQLNPGSSAYRYVAIPYDILQRASFQKHDLTKAPLPQRFPIILCTNMLYYYADNTHKNSDVPLETVLTNISNSLTPGGFLVCESETSPMAINAMGADSNYSTYSARLRQFPGLMERRDLVVPYPNRMTVTQNGEEAFTDRAQVFQLRAA